MRKTRNFSLMGLVILATFILVSVSAPSGVVTRLIPKAGDWAFAVQADKGDRVNGQVVVQLTSRANAKRVARRHNMEVEEDLEDKDNIYLFEIPDARTVDQAVAELKTDPDVVWAEPNYEVKVPEVNQRSHAFVDQRSHAFVDGQSPADYFGQYAVQLIRSGEAHAFATGRGVTVAVIDTGIDANHPVFTQVASGYDYIGRDGNYSEEGSGNAYGHGTMVAGIIALVAPQASILPLRVFDSTGVGKASNVAKAIDYAAEHGASVINMSFGLSNTSMVIHHAITSASLRGVVLIASAGNDNTSVPQYPASDPNVVAVAATDQYDVKALFSNYGSWVDVAAPGVSIYSAYPNNQWAWWDGTSFAAPFVSGEAALLLSIGQGTSRIQNTAVPVSGSGLGSGRIDCLAAVSR